MGAPLIALVQNVHSERKAQIAARLQRLPVIVKTAKNEELLALELDFLTVFAIMGGLSFETKMFAMFSMSKTSANNFVSSLDTADADTVVRQLFVVARGETTDESRELSARLIERFLVVHNLTPPRLAQEIGVAPQTVNRWLTAKITPRAAQVLKLQAMVQRAQLGKENDFADSGGNGADLLSLGARTVDYIMSLEINAASVWIVKNGFLRESARGYIGEQVLRAMHNGVRFNYVFFKDTAAAESFSRLQMSLAREGFSGVVTGYCLSDHRLAFEIGLSSSPGAWIGIEYSPSQTALLQRRCDVFHALPLREYTNAGKRQVKNDDGQPCWLELATPAAATWLNRIYKLTEGAEDGKEQITRIKS